MECDNCNTCDNIAKSNVQEQLKGLSRRYSMLKMC